MLRSLGPILLALVAALAAAAPAAAAGPFAPDSVWDARLDDGAPPVAGSAGLVAELHRQTTLPGGTWINAANYSVPVYTVGPSQPTVRVIADTPYPPLQAAWESVPIPAGARPAWGSDAHMVVHQPSTDTLWEFWAMYEAADGWHARWGAKMERVSANPGYFEGTLGATATSLALLGGLIRADEMVAGRIDHALALAIPEAKQGSVVWPAQRGDGRTGGAHAIPEGTRFRIDPDLDLDTLGLAPAARIIAQAAQDYGMVVRDLAGAVVLYAEDPAALGVDPWPALFNAWPNHLVDSLPWEHMEVVAPDRSAFAAPPAPVTPPGPVTTPEPAATPEPVAPAPPAPPSPPVAPSPAPAKTPAPKKPVVKKKAAKKRASAKRKAAKKKAAMARKAAARKKRARRT